MAIIGVINRKGGLGKTPIAVNTAKATGSIILTNDDDIVEVVHDNTKVMSLNEIAELDFNQLPNTVIDFGGFIEAGTTSIIKRCDLVVVPVVNNISSLKRSVNAIEELSQLNDNIIIVATMTTNKSDFENIKTTFKDYNIKAFFELKKTELFNNSLNKGLGIEDYLNTTPLLRSAYGKKKNQKTMSILEQWDKYITYIKNDIEENK
jgi:cellulose biosynthesis protein BcsQ